MVCVYVEHHHLHPPKMDGVPSFQIVEQCACEYFSEIRRGFSLLHLVTRWCILGHVQYEQILQPAILTEKVHMFRENLRSSLLFIVLEFLNIALVLLFQMFQNRALAIMKLP